MTINIVLLNQKDGAGRTTFADEIAWGLTRRGLRVGFCSIDPQGGACHEDSLLEGEGCVNIIDTPSHHPEKTSIEWAENADVVIVPTRPGSSDLKAMKQTVRSIEEANPRPSYGIIINEFSAHRVLDEQFLETLEADELPVLGTVPTAEVFKQSNALGCSVVEINPDGKATIAVEEIVDQITEEIHMASKFSKGTNFFAKEKEAGIAPEEAAACPEGRQEVFEKASEAAKTRQDAITSGDETVDREKAVLVSGYVPESMKKDLMIYKGATGQSVSEIVRRLLEKELSDKGFLNASSGLKH